MTADEISFASRGPIKLLLMEIDSLRTQRQPAAKGTPVTRGPAAAASRSSKAVSLSKQRQKRNRLRRWHSDITGDNNDCSLSSHETFTGKIEEICNEWGEIKPESAVCGSTGFKNSSGRGYDSEERMRDPSCSDSLRELQNRMEMLQEQLKSIITQYLGPDGSLWQELSAISRTQSEVKLEIQEMAAFIRRALNYVDRDTTSNDLDGPNNRSRSIRSAVREELRAIAEKGRLAKLKEQVGVSKAAVISASASMEQSPAHCGTCTLQGTDGSSMLPSSRIFPGPSDSNTMFCVREFVTTKFSQSMPSMTPPKTISANEEHMALMECKNANSNTTTGASVKINSQPTNSISFISSLNEGLDDQRQQKQVSSMIIRAASGAAEDISADNPVSVVPFQNCKTPYDLNTSNGSELGNTRTNRMTSPSPTLEEKSIPLRSPPFSTVKGSKKGNVHSSRTSIDPYAAVSQPPAASSLRAALSSQEPLDRNKRTETNAPIVRRSAALATAVPKENKLDPAARRKSADRLLPWSQVFVLTF